jgi:hypothetical protein
MSDDSKRYTIALPLDVHEKMVEAAKKHHTNSKDIVLRCLKLGLIAISIDGDEDKQIVIKEGEKETRILMV